MRAAALAAVSLAACSHGASIASCDDDLGGTWRSESGERWMILDNRATLEAYTLFDDTHPRSAPAGIEIGPRVIDLARATGSLAGDVKRRHGQSGTVCIARAPVHVTSCADDTLELVLADPTPPIAYAPCGWGRPEPSRRERWRRE
jgi:hypothetical protein